MKNRRYIIFFLLIFSSTIGVSAQTLLDTVLGFDEYLGYVKKYHPIVKQAELLIDESQANLMKARGGFDPKVEVDYGRKKFKNTAYYDKLNATFKIPTWYGIELKANYEEADGAYLNPENAVPVDGLYSAGISFSVAQGFLINERMASLKQGKLFREQAKADRDMLVNDILYNASLVYFDWMQANSEVAIYESFLSNAQMRFNGVKKNVEVGEVAAIDSVEARIVVNDRRLNLEKSRVHLMKVKLELSNYLWLENNLPVELQDAIYPDQNSELIIDVVLGIADTRPVVIDFDSHPKMQSLRYKYQSLELDRRLKRNMLLPIVNLQYNFLSETPEVSSSFNSSEYKSGLKVSMPLFLRKERGALRLANVKLQDTDYDIKSTRLRLQNKITAIKTELESFKVQNQITLDVLSDYERMLIAEERKFMAGESSLFLVNTRESKLIDAKLKAAELRTKFLSTKALLFNNLAVNPEF